VGSAEDAVAIYAFHARICKALADPKRLLIINELRDGPRSVNEISAALGISQSNASQHLAILRDRGIVSAERAGSNTFYAMRSPKIQQAIELLRQFMSEDLAGRIELGQLINASHPPIASQRTAG
jgi:DNA-binding transcriptional ArsR family regulator